MAGKSFADKVREVAKSRKPDNIISRIAKIKQNSHILLDNQDILDSLKDDTLTPEHLDTLTSKHFDKITNRHLLKQVPKQVSEQVLEHHNTITLKQDNTLTPKHIDNITIQQDNTLTPEHPNTLINRQLPPFNINFKPKDLMPNQFRILYEIYFQRPFKVKGPDRIGGLDDYLIPYGTVRYILKSLEKKGYIFTPFSVNSGVLKGTSCQVNESKCMPIFGSSPIINSEQVKQSLFEHLNTITRKHLNTWTSEQLNTLTPEHINTITPKHQNNPNNKLVSTYLNKLTNYLEHSNFWNTQGLNIKKCEEWISEFDFLKNNPELLITQLMFAEKTDSVLNPKSKTPVYVFYGCLKKGGLTRPKDFEFPEERAIRIKQEDLELKRKILADQAAIREKERILADEQAFSEFLNNKENINSLIIEIEKRFVTPKTKNSIKLYQKNGQIDSKLEN
ncbi:MAG: hypothetical protein KKH99_14570, partial [Proteobacteria bacterium]|nr:hypothetical protein [Pseudomonadota bacterium]